MSWEGDMQHEIEKLKAAMTPEQLITRAVSGMIAGHLDNFGLNFGMHCSCDPSMTIEFNEVLLMEAIAELKKNVANHE